MSRNTGVQRSRTIAVPILLALAVLLFSFPVGAQDSSKNEITFVRLANGEPGGEGIYSVNADGSDERLLFLFEDIGLPYDVYNGGYRCPVWSPDGTRIAMNGTEDGKSYLAIIDVETGDVERVYEVEHDDQTFRNVYYPSWVPGEDALSFGFTDADQNGVVSASGIRMVDLETGDVTTLRDDIDLNDGNSTYPRTLGGPVPNYTPFSNSWSPDGSQIALSSYNWRTHLLNADGSTLRELSIQYANGEAEWSPDGSTLATSLYRLVLIDPNDDTERELVSMGEMLNSSTIESLAWSPDGSEIAYSAALMDISSGTVMSAFSVSVVNAETGEIRELVRTPAFEWGAFPYNLACVDWRPTG